MNFIANIQAGTQHIRRKLSTGTGDDVDGSKAAKRNHQYEQGSGPILAYFSDEGRVVRLGHGVASADQFQVQTSRFLENMHFPRICNTHKCLLFLADAQAFLLETSAK